MNRKLLNLSGKIDSILTAVFEAISDGAESMGVPFFVVGATARDVILEYGHDIRTIRVTRDVDFGIRVPDWNQYDRLKAELVATGKFRQGREIQRLYHEKGLPVDIIPFGPLANCLNALTWPPDHEIEMNMLGFEEAYNHSLRVRVREDPRLNIRFASPAGLTLMKIISWSDRRADKDAQDIALLIRNYADAGNIERLYDEGDLLETEEFDLEHAGARLLGRDIAKISTPESTKSVLEILARETGEQKRYRLVEGMIKGLILNHDFDNVFEKSLQLLDKLKAGILDESSHHYAGKKVPDQREYDSGSEDETDIHLILKSTIITSEYHENPPHLHRK